MVGLTTSRTRSLLINLLVILLTLTQTSAEFPTQEFLDKIAPTVAKCEEETGVDKNMVKKFSEGDLVDNPVLKCYMKCMFVEVGVLDESTGQFHYEKMLSLIPKDMRVIAYEMGHSCIHFQGEGGIDLCQVSFDLHRCWQKNDPKHYFLL